MKFKNIYGDKKTGKILFEGKEPILEDELIKYMVQ